MGKEKELIEIVEKLVPHYGAHPRVKFDDPTGAWVIYESDGTYKVNPIHIDDAADLLTMFYSRKAHDALAGAVSFEHSKYVTEVEMPRSKFEVLS